MNPFHFNNKAWGKKKQTSDTGFSTCHMEFKYWLNYFNSPHIQVTQAIEPQIQWSSSCHICESLNNMSSKRSITRRIQFTSTLILTTNPQGFLMSTIHLIQIMQDKNNEISIQYLSLPSRWVTILSDKTLNGRIPLEMFEIKEVMTTKQS